jgi:hypothetical protein
MTAMVVLYTRRTGHPLGALATAVPGDPPSLEAADSYRLQVPIGTVTRPITVERADLAVASLEAEFNDPIAVFGWRVATAPGPDGKPQPRLDRPSSGAVGTITRGAAATITVPRFGSLERLAFEVRNKDRLVDSGRLTFAPADNEKLVPFTDPDPTEPIVVLVEGYQPKADP